MKRIELKHLKVMRLQPGDVVVATLPERASEDARTKIKAIIESNVPGHKCIVLCGGLRIGVVRAANPIGTTLDLKA